MPLLYDLQIGIYVYYRAVLVLNFNLKCRFLRQAINYTNVFHRSTKIYKFNGAGDEKSRPAVRVTAVIRTAGRLIIIACGRVVQRERRADRHIIRGNARTNRSRETANGRILCRFCRSNP